MHYDMDCFYAAIEIRDNPKLKGKSVIIGTRPPSRGVVSTASYEARKYGVRSGQSCNKALQLCPKAIFIRPEIKKYKEEHDKIRKIIEKYSDAIEYVALDEAYVDITNVSHLFGGKIKLAKAFKNDIFSMLGLTCSIGIGYNKLSAKLASEENKPNGLCIINNQNEFVKLVYNKKIEVIPGIGKETKKNFNKKGFFFVRDLYKLSLDDLKLNFGKRGLDFYYLVRGIDERKVESEYIQKSYGKEITFSEDIDDENYIMDILTKFVKELCFLLKEEKKYFSTITVKIKYCDFQSISRSKTILKPINNYMETINEVEKIFFEINLLKKVRLAGVYFSNITDKFIYQQSLFENKKIEKIDKLKHILKKKYGLNIILEDLTKK